MKDVFENYFLVVKKGFLTFIIVYLMFVIFILIASVPVKFSNFIYNFHDVYTVLYIYLSIDAGAGDGFAELGGEEERLADAGLGLVDALEVGEKDRTGFGVDIDVKWKIEKIGFLGVIADGWLRIGFGEGTVNAARSEDIE